MLLERIMDWGASLAGFTDLEALKSVVPQLFYNYSIKPILAFFTSFYKTMRNLHCSSPFTMDSSIMTSTGRPNAPSKRALAHPREQLQ